MHHPPAPDTMSNTDWLARGGPDYVRVWEWRQRVLRRIQRFPELLPGFNQYYADRPWDFINHWTVTYDPRRAGVGGAAYFPFIMFEKQETFVQMLHAAFLASSAQTSAPAIGVLVDKCREMGVTWLCCAFSVWLWRFVPGAAIGWGSRKAELVDKLGDPDSIFEKMRILLRWLPPLLLPAKFDINDARCVSQMRILNPETGASIVGEAGDNIGRGGRKRVYFLDEAAHVERAEMVEAALESNTNFRVDISTTAGVATVFQRKRDAGLTWTPGANFTADRVNVFVFDWWDHPLKSQEWYDTKKTKAANEGLSHIFAQEVDRDPSAAIFGTVILGDWVRSAIGARQALGIRPGGQRSAGLDVADGISSGADLNGLVIREGVEAFYAQEWGERDVGVTTRRALDEVSGHGSVEVQYDSIGIGAAVKAEVNRLTDLKLMPPKVRFIAWSAADEPIDPEGRVNPNDDDSPINSEFFQNLKAQAWWQVARRFEKTHRARTESGFTWVEDDIISLDPAMPGLSELMRQLSQPVMTKSPATLRLVVNKTPSGTRSPNMGDAFIMAFWPINVTRPMVISSDLMQGIRKRSGLRRQLRAMGYA